MEVSIKEEPGDPEEFLSEPGCSKSHAVWCVDDSKPNVNELSSDRVSIQPVCTKVENELEPDEFENVAIKEEMEDSESSRMSASVKSEIEDQHLECELKEEEEEDSDEFESQQFEEETLDIKEEGETSVKEDPLENPEEDKWLCDSDSEFDDSDKDPDYLPYEENNQSNLLNSEDEVRKFT
ncbi:hypothetical protein C0J52_07336 [Blattella germanica]|nr:hypothetical protein C0J52_07336 [Blattella germanica]